jgi:hypothetical protein
MSEKCQTLNAQPTTPTSPDRRKKHLFRLFTQEDRTFGADPVLLVAQRWPFEVNWVLLVGGYWPSEVDLLLFVEGFCPPEVDLFLSVVEGWAHEASWVLLAAEHWPREPIWMKHPSPSARSLRRDTGVVRHTGQDPASQLSPRWIPHSRCNTPDGERLAGHCFQASEENFSSRRKR